MIKNFSKLLYSSLFILLLAGSSNAQEVIKGTVLGIEEGTRSPVTGASVQWINTTKGTITNAEGKFELAIANISDKRVIVSMMGFNSDTISADTGKDLLIQFRFCFQLFQIL